MRLPWDDSEKDDRIEELEEKVAELEEEKQSYRERFEAEKERRSEETSERQDAQRKIKKLEQKVESLKQQESDAEEPGEVGEREKTPVEVETVVEGLRKLESIESKRSDLLTAYLIDGFEGMDEVRELKNSVSKDYLEGAEDASKTVLFTDGCFFDVELRTRPFFEPEWALSDSFAVERILEFVQDRKTWVAVSAGETRIVEEQDGELIDREVVESRVDRKHSQGGFSQGRFERKRDEQIQEHLKEVRNRLETDEFYVVGDERLASRLKGEYLGGFDQDRDLIEALYAFRLVD